MQLDDPDPGMHTATGRKWEEHMRLVPLVRTPLSTTVRRGGNSL